MRSVRPGTGLVALPIADMMNHPTGGPIAQVEPGAGSQHRPTRGWASSAGRTVRIALASPRQPGRRAALQRIDRRLRLRIKKLRWWGSHRSGSPGGGTAAAELTDVLGPLCLGF